MTARRTAPRIVAAALAAVLLLLPAIPAFAEPDSTSPTIVSGVVVAGVDLSGLTASEAETTLTANATSTLAPLAASAKGTIYTLKVSTVATLAVTDLVNDALAATSSVDIPARYSADSTVVANAVAKFVANIASHTNCKVLNSKRKIVKRRLKITKSRVGLSVNQKATVSAVTTAVVSELAAGGSHQATVTVTIKSTKPKTTAKNIGKTIVVVLRERRVYLYSGSKTQKKYRCAIGKAGHRTPTGTFKIVRKVKLPTWYNPGSGWAKNMPASIAPGANNPLGLRALYLNASGIRIHGIPKSENSSIGHAASHGCIRLTNHNILDLYPRVKVGTPVYIVK
jgi:lipoprotein-anchoring transpeptidase ErfK/SrfK